MIPVAHLDHWASALLEAAGFEPRHARQVAATLLAADCLGHHTHGLELLPRAIADLSRGAVTSQGRMQAVRDSGPVLVFDAGRLPGPVALHEALDEALPRVATHGTVTLVVRNSGHIACLATYLERATYLRFLMLMASSNPSVTVVAPHGATRPAYSPNPVAFGFPTHGDPVWIDVSMSAVSVNSCRQAAERGERLSGSYLRLADGSVTDDPAAAFGNPPAALMPLGGTDLGHKGYGLGLMVEMLTSGLAGSGRSNEETNFSNTTFVYLADAEAFGGSAHLLDEGSWLVRACREAGAEGDVRVPGERALAKRRLALAEGLALQPALLAELERLAVRFGLPPLQPFPERTGP